MTELPNKPNVRKALIISAGIISLAIACAAAMPARSGTAKLPVLEIADAASGKKYGRWTLREPYFSIEFTHSVNQSPVREKFKAEGKMIRPCEVRFASFGAGMQSDLEPGQTMTRDGGTMVITGNYAPHPELNCIIGTVSDHLLIIGEESISLRELCGQNARVSIRIQ